MIYIPCPPPRMGCLLYEIEILDQSTWTLPHSWSKGSNQSQQRPLKSLYLQNHTYQKVELYNQLKTKLSKPITCLKRKAYQFLSFSDSAITGLTCTMLLPRVDKDIPEITCKGTLHKMIFFSYNKEATTQECIKSKKCFWKMS